MSSDKVLPRINRVEFVFYFSGNTNDYTIMIVSGDDESIAKLHNVEDTKLKEELGNEIGVDMETGKALGFPCGSVVNLGRVACFRINIYR